MNEIKHPLKYIKLKNKATADEINSTKQLAYESFCAHVKDCYKDKENCFMSNDKKHTKCECYLQLFDPNLLSIVAKIVSELVTSSSEQRNKFTQDIIGGGHAIQSTATGRNLNCYVVDKDNKIAFCKNTVQLVLCVGRIKFNTITKNYGTTTPKTHGKTGRYNNDINVNTLRDDIESFIKSLANEEGESHTTRFLREHNKVCIRDAEIDTIKLPSYFTKRHVYRQYCWEKGWIAKTNGIGELQHTERENTDILPVLSWSSFLRVWGSRCSLIRMRPPSRCTCDLCFKHKMIIKGLKDNAQMLTENESSDDEDDTNNQYILDSATHMRQARAQRVCSNEKIRICKESKKQNLHFYRSNYVITFDCAQNLQLPYFGEEQPGDT